MKSVFGTIGALVLVVAVGCAQDVRVSLPALPLEMPISPVVETVEITHAGWGPFRRSCSDAAGHGEGVHPGAQPFHRRSCVTYSAASMPGGWWRIVATGLPPSAQDLSLSFERSSTGQVRHAAFFGSGVARLPPAEQGAVQHLAQLMTRYGWLPRQRLGQNGVFLTEIPPPIVGRQPFPVSCHVVGRSIIERRDVLVANCQGDGPVSLVGTAGEGQLTGRMILTGHLAIDIQTGVFLASTMEGRAQGTIVRSPTGAAAPVSLVVRVRSWVD